VASRRMLILIAAIVVGAVAAVAIYSYVSTVQDRAYDNARLVKVFVVKKDVGKGLPGEQAIDEDFVRSDQIPQKFRPGTALTDLNTIRGKVALSNLSSGQVVVEGQFVDPRVAQVTFAQRIPAGQQAITLSFDQIRGVAGLLVPGDKVNMIICDPRSVIGTATQGAGCNGRTFLFQNLTILAIGQSAAPQAGEAPTTTVAGGQTPGSGLITFAVPPLAAEKLAFVGGNAGSGGGQIDPYLTLVPPDNQPVVVPPVNLNNLISGGLTPEQG
jgi:pilus assembly protein CpaB